jgi:hypothetical protein
MIRIHPDDVMINRTSMRAEVYDPDGGLVFWCSLSYSDFQINEMVGIANQCFRDGFERGSESRAGQIRAALGIKEARDEQLR